jgi:hypothetical protein
VCESNTPATSKMPPAGFEDRELHPQPYASSTSYESTVPFNPFQCYSALGETHLWPNKAPRIFNRNRSESTSEDARGAKVLPAAFSGPSYTNRNSMKRFYRVQCKGSSAGTIECAPWVEIAESRPCRRSESETGPRCPSHEVEGSNGKSGTSRATQTEDGRTGDRTGQAVGC